MGGRPALPQEAMVMSGPELQSTAMCGSVAQLQRGSMWMFVVPVTTKGHGDVPVLCCYLGDVSILEP